MRYVKRRVFILLVVFCFMFASLSASKADAKKADKYWICDTVDDMFVSLAHVYYSGNKIQIKGRVMKTETLYDNDNDDEIIKKYNRKFKVSKNCKVLIYNYDGLKKISYKKWKKNFNKGDEMLENFNIEVSENKVTQIITRQ